MLINIAVVEYEKRLMSFCFFDQRSQRFILNMTDSVNIDKH